MSTIYYALGTEEGPAVVLTEHSSLLDLELVQPRIEHDTNGDVTTATLADLTPDQVVSTALQLLRVASYQYEEHEFVNAVRAAIRADGSPYLQETIMAVYEALPRHD